MCDLINASQRSRATVLCQKATIALAAGKLKEAIETFTLALGASREEGAVRIGLFSAVGLARALLASDRPGEALSHLVDANGVALEAEDREVAEAIGSLIARAKADVDGTSARALWRQAVNSSRSQHSATSIALFERAAEAARSEQDDGQIAASLYGLARVWMESIQPARAWPAIIEGLELARKAGAQDLVAQLERMQAELAETITRIESTEQRLSLAVSGAADNAAIAHLYWAEAEAVVKRDPILGHHLADKALLYAERAGIQAVQGNAYALKATVAYSFRRLDEARDYAEKCLALTTEQERSSLASLMPQLLSVVAKEEQP
jgi:hypothetical protein